MSPRAGRLGQAAVGLALAGAAVAGVGAVTSASRAGDPPAPPALPVVTVAVVPVTSHTVTRSFSGSLRARRTVDLAFEVGGRLSAVAVRAGDWAAAGARLAHLDDRRLAARRDALRAQRAQAEAVLSELEAGPRAEVIATARARCRELKTRVDLLARKRQRREGLRARGVVTGEELDEVTAALAVETARAEAAQRQLEELLAGTRPERLAAQRAQVQQLDAELARLEIELADAILGAPFAGRVAAVHRDPGAVVQPGEPILRLVEAGALEAWVGVPAGLAPPPLGAELQVHGPAGPTAGRLTAVLPVLDAATRTATWVVTLDEALEGALPGAVVRLGVSHSAEGGGVWLPLSALAQGQGPVWSCLVAVPRDGAFVVERRLVEVVELDGERVLVRGALARGEAVVAAGTARVVPGQRVRPSQPPRDPDAP